MSTLIFDIETVGENFDVLDSSTQGALTNWIRKESGSEEEYAVALEDVKRGLGFSPLTGEIVAIGVMDYEKRKGAVYYATGDSPGSGNESGESDMKYKPMTEKEMLESFWNGARQYDTFVTFSGRAFDVPFMMIRSAIHGIRPSKDLMRGRYLYQQLDTARHIDLLDQLTFYGSVRRKGNLHLWARAFGIESPKAEGVTGDDVGALYTEKKYLDIAKYNARDVVATAELYDRWVKYVAF